MRRPSPAMLVASLALFIALGGPAQAKRLINGADIRKGTVRSTQIKDHTIQTRDLNHAAVRALRVPNNGAVTEAKIADNAVTNLKLGPGSVTTAKLGNGAVNGAAIADLSVGTADLADGAVNGAKLGDNSVSGAKIADGSLTTADVARFAGRFRVTQSDLGTTLAPGTCWSGEPHGLAPELAGVDISGDALLVTPRTPFNEKAMTFSYHMAATNASDPGSLSRFVLAFCNVAGSSTFTWPTEGMVFNYVVFDIP